MDASEVSQRLNTLDPTTAEQVRMLGEWSGNIFLFSFEALGMLPAEPLDELRGRKIHYTNVYGEKTEIELFNHKGELTFGDLSFYSIEMFKNQTREAFRRYNGKRFTWQQTVILTAYNRAINTFGQDAYESFMRNISVRSGHGIGKTAAMSVIALHFLICYPGAQIGFTANTEQQVEDIFMKEFAKWKNKLPSFLNSQIKQVEGAISIKGTKDWFLRAVVAKPDKPESVAGLHGPYVLVLFDEASAIHTKIYNVIQGAFSGLNWAFMEISNPTRTEGEFYDHQQPGSNYTRLKFTCRESPVVQEGFIEKIEKENPGIGDQSSDEVKIRIDGEFAGTTEMDDKGWIPLFANVSINFEAPNRQVLYHPLIGVDPAGAGRDRSIINVRDSIYLKNVLNEATSNPKDLARKVETVRDIYQTSSSDIGIDAFGEGARTIAEINTTVNDPVNAILADNPKEETKDLYNSYKSELAWKLRSWIIQGGITVTNNKALWLKEFGDIRYKRDTKGRISLMPKPLFKKLFGYSPDLFDASCYTMHKDSPTRVPPTTKTDQEVADHTAFIARLSTQSDNKSLSSMGE